MIPNQFTTELAPLDAQQAPQVDLQAMQYNAALRARELNSQLALKNLAANQWVHNEGRGIGIAGQQVGKLGAVTIGRAAATALDSNSSSLSSVAGPALGIAAAGYGAYQGNRQASHDLNVLHQQISSGDLTPEQVDAARQRSFNAGMVSFGLGSTGGLLGSGVLGALAGASGGARQAYGSYDNFPDAARAFANFVKDPFKK